MDPSRYSANAYPFDRAEVTSFTRLNAYKNKIKIMITENISWSRAIPSSRINSYFIKIKIYTITRVISVYFTELPAPPPSAPTFITARKKRFSRRGGGGENDFSKKIYTHELTRRRRYKRKRGKMIYLTLIYNIVIHFGNVVSWIRIHFFSSMKT